MTEGATPVLGCIVDLEYLGHALAARLLQHAVGARVFVRYGPGGILVSKDAAFRARATRRHAMTVGRSATACANKRMRCGLSQACPDRHYHDQNWLHISITSSTTPGPAPDRAAMQHRSRCTDPIAAIA